jgi:hypothetical protein
LKDELKERQRRMVEADLKVEYLGKLNEALIAEAS